MSFQRSTPTSSASLDDKLQKFDALLTGLRRQTRYVITVQAFNGRGTGPASEPLLVRTLELDPPRQLKLYVKQSSNCSIQLEWRPLSQAASLLRASSQPAAPPPPPPPPVGEGDTVDYYSLYQAELNEQPRWLESRLPGQASSHSVEQLKCGTRYQFYMMGVNKIGIGDQSDILDTKTAGGAPIAPDRQSTFDVANATCYVVRLDHWQDNGCPIKRFNVRYKLESAREWTQVAHFDLIESAASGAQQTTEGAPKANNSTQVQQRQQQQFRSARHLSLDEEEPAAAEETDERLDSLWRNENALKNENDDSPLLDYSLAEAAAALEEQTQDKASGADYLALEAAALLGKEEAPEMDVEEQEMALNGNNNQPFGHLKMAPDERATPSFSDRPLEEAQSRSHLSKMPQLAQEWQASNFVLDSSMLANQEPSVRVSASARDENTWRRVRLCNLQENLYYSVQIRAANRVGETEAELRLLTSQEGLEWEPLLKRHVVGRLGGRNNPPPPPPPASEQTGPLDRVMAHSMASFNESLFAFEQWPILVPVTLLLTLITVIIIIALLLKKTPGGAAASPPGSTGTCTTTTSTTANGGAGGGGTGISGCSALMGPGSANGGSNCSSSGYMDDVTPLNHHSHLSAGSSVQQQQHHHHFATLHHLPSHGHSHSTSSSLHHMSLGTLKPQHLHRYHLQQQHEIINETSDSADQLMLGASAANDNYATLGPQTQQQQQQQLGATLSRCSNANSSQNETSHSAHQFSASNEQQQQQQQQQQNHNGPVSPSFTADSTNLNNIYQQRQTAQLVGQLAGYGFNPTQGEPSNSTMLLSSAGNSLTESSNHHHQSSSSPATTAPLSSLNSSSVGAQSAAHLQAAIAATTLPQHHNHSHHHHLQHQQQIDARPVNVYLCAKEDANQKDHDTAAIIYGLTSMDSNNNNNNNNNNNGLHQTATLYGGNRVQLSSSRYQIPDAMLQDQHQHRDEPFEPQMDTSNTGGDCTATNISNQPGERLILDPVYATIRRTFPQAFKYLTLQHNNQQQLYPPQQQQQQQQLSQTDGTFFESVGK